MAFKWNGFSNEELASLKVPILIINDFVRFEHAVDTSKRVPNAELAVILDASHFVLFSEPERMMPIVKNFLEKPEKRIPLGTAANRHRPGETR